jgi:uncharacterized protein (DUF1800 family)
MTATDPSLIAVNRFGLGARPGELRLAKSDPRGWLSQQLQGSRPVPEAIARLPSGAAIFADYTNAIEDRRDARRAERPAATMPPDQAQLAQRIAQSVRQVLAPRYQQQVAARYQVAGRSAESFRERLVHFWSNHFAVSSDKAIVLGLVGALENEAIRPHLAGNFADMLLAVERHPAMILYLDNQQSTGPHSPFAQRLARRPNAQRKAGINENLAREIMELHTLGVNGGYTQADVTTFAQALTGWSVGGGRGPFADGRSGEFVFRDLMHEPGAKTILGKQYAEGGQAQAEAVLKDLAAHSATAKFIATKLARHLIADEPPAAAVDKIAKVFRDTRGDLPSVHRAVVEQAQAWQQAFAKFKTPHEFVLSTFRALDFVPEQPNQIAAPFELLGQRPYTPGSPAGWADTAGHWDGPDALLKRIEWATAMGQRADPQRAPLELASEILAGSLSDHSRTAIARAASGAQALTLLLVSPEFQRR